MTQQKLLKWKKKMKTYLKMNKLNKNYHKMKNNNDY